MQNLADNLHLIRETWKISAADIPNLVGIKLTRESVYSYEKKTKPSIDYLLKMEELSGFTVRELCTTKINKFDLPDRPYRHGEGLQIITDKIETIKVKEPAIPYGKPGPTDNETIIVQRKLIAMLEARILELEKQLKSEK